MHKIQPKVETNIVILLKYLDSLSRNITESDSAAGLMCYPSAGAGVMSPPSQQQQTAYFQKQISLPSSKRGCHVMTREILRQLPELKDFEVCTALQKPAALLLIAPVTHL